MKLKSFLAAGIVLAFAVGCSEVNGPDEEAQDAALIGENSKNFLVGFNPASVKVLQAGKSIESVCKITSTKYETASFSVPGKVNLPAYSSGAVNATLTCSVGDEVKSVAFAPENLSAKARNGNAVGVFLLCPICGLGVAAANAGADTSSDVYGFSEINLEL